jgi:hypothetical protein
LDVATLDEGSDEVKVMAGEFGRHFLQDALRQLQKLKRLAEGALAQVSDAQFFHRLDPESNSMALIVKHLAGNMRSRWRDFLTSDGEKSDRHRDREFEHEAGDTRDALMRSWEGGWTSAFSAIGSLRTEDLTTTVTIRGEAHTVMEAIQRQLTHYAYHVGQVIFIAKHLVGPDWRSLSIPRGRSADVEVSKTGGTYRPEHRKAEGEV